MKRAQLFGKTLMVDFLMSNLAILLGIMMLSSVSQKQKKIVEEKAGLRTEGKYAIVLQWPGESADDVDLYVRDPSGRIVFFNARERGQMHLEHDDRGKQQGQKASTDAPRTREERVIMRGVIPGEYIVNVHMYHKWDTAPTPVRVRLVALKGIDDELAERDLVLSTNGAEATAFRFTMSEGGTVTGTNRLERRLIGPQGDPLHPGGF